jgi:hypothetical protein
MKRYDRQEKAARAAGLRSAGRGHPHLAHTVIQRLAVAVDSPEGSAVHGRHLSGEMRKGSLVISLGITQALAIVLDTHLDA